MNDALKEQTVGSSNAPRDEGQQDKADWDLYTAHYGISGERIPMLRVLGWGTDCYVVEITSLSKNEGRIIAECDFNEGEYGPYFTTTAEQYGHLALCRFLWSLGVGGRYKKWLRAVNENQKSLAEELRGSAKIQFSLRLTDAKPEDWTINTTLEDDAEEKEHTPAEESAD
ncbi:MAG: hypothetical protein PVI66_16905 [Candidatus Aminicenantes bacterium]|jgi:hypothetical protein